MDLLRSPELSSGERPGSGDQSPRPDVILSLSLKETPNPFGAVGGRRGNKASLSFAQSLWRSHPVAVLDDQRSFAIRSFHLAAPRVRAVAAP
jgi:hypothetical protein